jgi:CHAD domain-containing protein
LNEPLVIRQCMGEALHQTRVAMRRLRSAFSLFKPAVEDLEFQHLRHELRWFTGQLGDARNIDVYLQQLDKEQRRTVMEARDRAYVQVADAMNSQRFRRLLVDIVGWTAIGSWRSAKPASRPITAFANLRLDKFWRTVEAAGPVEAMDETSRHQLRIQVKKIRYATEFLEGLYPEARRAEKAFGKAVEKLQEELGKLNDLTTARGFASEIPDGGPPTGSNEERRHLRSAEEALSALLKIGDFWRRTERSRREPARSTSRAS